MAEQGRRLVQLRRQRRAFHWLPCIGNDPKAGGLGNLGDDQLEWLEDDLEGAPRRPQLSSLRISRSGAFTRSGDGALDDAARALDYPLLPGR
jgi:hypothetical protein